MAGSSSGFTSSSIGTQYIPSAVNSSSHSSSRRSSRSRASRYRRSSASCRVSSAIPVSSRLADYVHEIIQVALKGKKILPCDIVESAVEPPVPFAVVQRLAEEQIELQAVTAWAGRRTARSIVGAGGVFNCPSAWTIRDRDRRATRALAPD